MHSEFWIGVSSVCFFVILGRYSIGPMNRMVDNRRKEFTDEMARLSALTRKAEDLTAYYDRYFCRVKSFENKALKEAETEFATLKNEILQQQKRYQHRQLDKLHQSLRAIRQESNEQIQHLLKVRMRLLVEMYLLHRSNHYYTNFADKRYHKAIQDLMHRDAK